MDLVVLGAGSPYPRAGMACSGYLIRSGSARVWVDPGPGTLANLLHIEQLSNLDAIWVSHLHADHTADLILTVYALDDGNLGSGQPIPVLSPPGLRERTAAFLGTQPEALDRFFTFHDLRDGHEWLIGGLRLVSTAVEHGSVDAYAVRAVDADSTLVFTGDTRLCLALVDAAAGADLLLCEANHPSRDDPRSTVHLSAEDAGELARRSKAGLLLLTHIESGIDVQAIMASAATEFPGQIDIAAEGDIVQVGAAP